MWIPVGTHSDAQAHFPKFKPVLWARCNSQGWYRFLAFEGRWIVLTRLLRRMQGEAQPVSQSVPPIAVLEYCLRPLCSVAVPKRSSQSKRRRKPVRVEGLYLEPEPEPKSMREHSCN